MVAGAGLRLWQYLANSSLWIDEIALTRNIIDRPLVDLVKPLDYAQVAPIGFLFVEKTVTSLFGTSEYALRAFPLASGLAALALFWGVARQVLQGWAVPYAVALFSLGVPFIYFSSQVKQYSSDTAAALLLLLVTLRVWRRGVTPRRAIALGFVGVAAAVFSQPALFVMAGIGAGLLILVRTQRDGAVARSLSIALTIWALTAGAVTVHALSSVTEIDREYFRDFWASGFMPMPPRSLSDAAWLPGKLVWVFGAFAVGMGPTNGGMNYRWSPVFAAVMLYGAWALWRRQRDAALFLTLPLLVVLAASVTSIYPFTARLVAFLIPALLIVTAAGASHLLTHWPKHVGFLSPVALAILGGAPIYAAVTALPPSWVQHARPVIEHVASGRRPSDKIYAFYGASPAIGYYAPRFGLQREDVVFGKCNLRDPREYLRELEGMRGASRIWIVATHTQRKEELDLILAYMDQIGRRVDTVIVPGSAGRWIEDASGYLFDLSDRQRLTSVSANTYPVALEPPFPALAEWGCHGVIGGHTPL